MAISHASHLHHKLPIAIGGSVVLLRSNDINIYISVGQFSRKLSHVSLQASINLYHNETEHEMFARETFMHCTRSIIINFMIASTNDIYADTKDKIQFLLAI